MARSLILVLLAAAVVSSHGMPTGMIDEATQLWSLTKRAGGDLTNWLLTSDNKGDSHGDTEHFGAIITKFVVAPGKAREFIEAWKATETPTRKEEGNLVYDLKKVITDNVLFYEYAEYANKSAYIEHLTSPYVKEFIKKVATLNIYVELIPTINIKTEQGPQMYNNAAKVLTADWSDKPFYVVIDYVVAPSEAEEWVHAFREFMVEVSEEEGVKLHALHKTLTDNVSYKVYGAWKTLQDYWDHLASKHMKKLLEFNADRGIIFDVKPLVKIGEQPEMEA